MAKAKKIPATKTSRITVGSTNHYKLEPAVTRTHYGEYRQDRGGQPYAFPSKRADEAWFVVSDWTGTRHGLVQQWNDGEWTFSKIEGQQQAPSWLRAQYHDTPSTIYNLSSRLYSGTTPEEAIAKGLGIPLASAQASHATVKKSSGRTAPTGGYVEYRPRFQTAAGSWIDDDRGHASLEPARRRADILQREGGKAIVEERAYDHLGHVVARDVVYRSSAEPRRYPGSHATKKKIVVRKVEERWQPVDDRGMVVRGKIYNADGTGYSTRQGAAEAAAMLRQLGGRG